ARAFGVKTGMTLPEARQICPGLIPVQGDLDKYIETSLRIHKILLNYTDMVEVFSIDECFMDVTATQHLFGGALNIAREIKAEIKRIRAVMLRWNRAKPGGFKNSRQDAQTGRAYRS
ncbi:MAG TPA: hypothetical protein PKJ42_04190, partial [Candidatus Goldiibacteriota bacterium]|nr:hypothetical protein [Candidatus Goldiibacteriota bacterium]